MTRERIQNFCCINCLNTIVEYIIACDPHMETHQQAMVTEDPVTTFKNRFEKLSEKHAIPGLSLVVRSRQLFFSLKVLGTLISKIKYRQPQKPLTTLLR